MIIINNVNFDEAGQFADPEVRSLKEREGSDQDAASLWDTFTGFGFLCMTERNKKGQVRFLLHHWNWNKMAQKYH